MGREEKRAAMRRLNKKFTGIDITKGVLEVPVTGREEPLKVDINNFDTILHLSDMCDKFSDIEKAYPEESEAIEAIKQERDAAAEAIQRDIDNARTDAEEADLRRKKRAVISEFDNKCVRHMMAMYKKLITDFTVHVDAIFGEGATLKIFGNTSPMPQAIGEFIEDIGPVVEAMVTMLNPEAN